MIRNRTLNKTLKYHGAKTRSGAYATFCTFRKSGDYFFDWVKEGGGGIVVGPYMLRAQAKRYGIKSVGLADTPDQLKELCELNLNLEGD